MELEKYNNILPEQFNYESQRYNDIQMLKRLKHAMEAGEVMSGECIKTTENGDMVIDLSPNIIGIIPRSEVTYIVEEDGKVHRESAEEGFPECIL